MAQVDGVLAEGPCFINDSKIQGALIFLKVSVRLNLTGQFSFQGNTT